MHTTDQAMKPILVILAAGMASRYGSAKQVDGFGPNNETIIDYSIYDAIKAGFGKVVFVIREEFLTTMQANFDAKLRGKIEVAYAFQDFNLKKFGVDTVVEREKPWGTAHAVMSAEQAIDRPFCVINADDFYGFDAFQKMHDFLVNEAHDEEMAMVGFEIGNTLSDHGYVSRGVCAIDDKGYMQSVTERTNIYRGADACADSIVYKEGEQEHPLSAETLVSMNFWGFTPKIIDVARSLFPDFVQKNKSNPKAEFFIPSIPDYMAKMGLARFKVIPTSSPWFGVTYKEDKEQVRDSIRQLVALQTYPHTLYAADKRVDAALYLEQ
ncbi:nucleotidyltransferase family protein [Sphingobacterium griseoflavum]|uniref:Nucleotidyltransferase n=1 Tax=Sphingobacterium griseoflavum TaxID=1474952 RepID=A0ABQ3I0X3_9SPHI|nr:sugar phosphate nucleotidyltransferase [Sphingobacterium griseoflavum]GHE38987.1 nucleotidyltransferase [Sphingobacterium griseoflavum]